MSKIGRLIAVTSNSGLNDSVCRWFEKELGAEKTLRLASKEEAENPNLPVPKDVLFNTRTDFITIAQYLRKKEPYGTEKIENAAFLEDFLSKKGQTIIPVLFQKENNEIELISGYSGKFENGNLIYIKTESFVEMSENQENL